MQSIFDEEELQYRQARMVMPMLAPITIDTGYIMPTMERATYRVNGKRKRTVSEALVRVQRGGGPLWQRGKKIPFTAPYAYALQGLAYGLVIVDPLNRLEGGLID